MPSDFSTLRDLLAKSFSRYINVLPTGLQLPLGQIVPSLEATLIHVSPARTLYQNRKPACRSLDGIKSVKEGRPCASCPSRKTCTPQIFLEILSDDVPLSLLIAYTSARNFIRFAGTLKAQGQSLENAVTLMTVRDRGRWGEVSFTLKSQKPLS